MKHIRHVIPAPSDNADNSEPVGPDSPIAAFATYLRVEKGLCENTIEYYSADLRQFAKYLKRRHRPLTTADRSDVQGYMGWLFSRGTKPRSICRKLAVLRSFYGFLLDDEVITTNPARNVPSPKLGRPLPRGCSAADLEKMVRSLGKRSPVDLRDRAILQTFYASGLRVAELCKLELRDLDLDAGAAKVWKGKGGKDAIVLLNPLAIAALNLYLAKARSKLANGRPSSAVFISRLGHSLTRQQVNYRIKDIAKRALGRLLTPHHLRHGFATALVEGGADIRDVQALMRHSDINTTQVYVHTDLNYLRRIYAGTHPRA